MSNNLGIDLHLSHHDRRELEKIIQSLIPDFEVWAFGSRVLGKEKEYSDLDLVIKTDKPLTLAQKADLQTAFAESDLTIKVDISDWSLASENFRKLIEKKYTVIHNNTKS